MKKIQRNADLFLFLAIGLGYYKLNTYKIA